MKCISDAQPRESRPRPNHDHGPLSWKFPKLFPLALLELVTIQLIVYLVHRQKIILKHAAEL